MLDSAVLSLARITRSEDASRVIKDILKLLGSEHDTAMQSSTVSLGVLGSPASLDTLYELMIDSKAGRRLVGKHEVPVLVRSFAALAFGLINAPNSASKLINVIKRTPDKDLDLKACAIIALGLMKNNPDRMMIINALLDCMNDRKMHFLAKAQVPVSLGKLGDSVALSAIIKAFKAKKQHNNVRQSCAIALGLLASMEDEEAINLLKAYIRDGKDDQTRHFAYIALGRIGAGNQNYEGHLTAQMDLARFFKKEIMKPSRKTHKPWAALAAAIHARKHEVLQGDVIDKLGEVFNKERNPSYRGAFAIALGLLDARGKADDLFEALLESSDKPLKGYLCVALGLMKHRAAADRIRVIAEREKTSPRLQLQAAIARGLMGDLDAVNVLIGSLKEAQTVSVISSAARALGFIGDISAVQPLLDIVNDDKAQKLVRAFAAVALGIIGAKTHLPWYSAITESLNYRASLATTIEVLSLL
jgi:HEAT repeat protein